MDNISIPVANVILRGVTTIEEKLVEIKTHPGITQINYAVFKDNDGLLKITGLYVDDPATNSIIIPSYDYIDLINNGSMEYFMAYQLIDIELNACNAFKKGDK